VATPDYRHRQFLGCCRRRQEKAKGENHLKFDNLRFPSGPRFKSPLGGRFDRLFVLAFSGNRKGQSCWKCVCDCGEMCQMSMRSLTRCDSRSCGCHKVNLQGTIKGKVCSDKKKKSSSYDSVHMPTSKSFKNILGSRFGMLFVLAFAGRKGESLLWKCVCDCGNMRIVRGADLRIGKYKSCGCDGSVRKRSDKEKSAEYNAWANMRRRCGDPSNKDYHLYGGKGITVCERWVDFSNFLEDMGKKPSRSHSIDRIDSNGNYDPENCRWATAKQQARNISTNVMLDHNGETRCLSEWAEIKGILAPTLRARINSGWSIYDAIETPVGQKRVSR
jgi:hypothetical protein